MYFFMLSQSTNFQWKNEEIVMKKHYQLIILGALLGLAIGLPGCAAEPPVAMVPQAVSNINIIDSTMSPNVITLPNCALKGQILVRTYDRVKTDKLVLNADEKREIENKAMLLNANSVVLKRYQILFDKGMYVHVINADAYYCNIPNY